jgi:hypothetical protein
MQPFEHRESVHVAGHGLAIDQSRFTAATMSG